LKTNVRKGTVVARWGGEEFLAVFPNMELSIAALIMERFREKVANTIRVEERVVTLAAACLKFAGTTRRVWKKFKPGSSKKPIRISTQPNETGGTKCIGNP
jgi:GGDEF domain-containing protein